MVNGQWTFTYPPTRGISPTYFRTRVRHERTRFSFCQTWTPLRRHGRAAPFTLVAAHAAVCVNCAARDTVEPSLNLYSHLSSLHLWTYLPYSLKQIPPRATTLHAFLCPILYLSTYLAYFFAIHFIRDYITTCNAGHTCRFRNDAQDTRADAGRPNI